VGFVMVLFASCSDTSPAPALTPTSDAATSPDASAASVTGYVDPALANTKATPAPARQGLQYSGSVALLSVAQTQPAGGLDASTEAWVELSAAILPKVGVLYTGQGEDYPTTPQAQAKLAHDSALTFETLLRECQPLNPGIVLWQAGDPPLSDLAVSTNYRLREECAYDQYLAKPYWIPQLIHDVDICRQELGPGWRMLTEADVLVLLQTDTRSVQETLDGVQNSGVHPGSFYFSLSVWVLRTDGSVGAANLRPGADPVITSLSGNDIFFDPRLHYEGGLTLRCLRVTSL